MPRHIAAAMHHGSSRHRRRRLPRLGVRARRSFIGKKASPVILNCNRGLMVVSAEPRRFPLRLSPAIEMHRCADRYLDKRCRVMVESALPRIDRHVAP